MSENLKDYQRNSEKCRTLHLTVVVDLFSSGISHISPPISLTVHLIEILAYKKVTRFLAIEIILSFPNFKMTIKFRCKLHTFLHDNETLDDLPPSYEIKGILEALELNNRRYVQVQGGGAESERKCLRIAKITDLFIQIH